MVEVFSRPLRWLLPAAAILSFAPEVSAQETAASDESGSDTGVLGTSDVARARFEEGVRLFREGDFVGALEQFRASFDAQPNPALRYNIGVCQYNLQRPVESRRELALYLSETDPSLVSERRRQEVDSILAGLDAGLGLFDLRLGVAGARVTVDGVDVGATPLSGPVPVLPGAHQIRVVLEGRVLFEEQVPFDAGERRTIVVAGMPLQVPVTSGAGSTSTGEPSGVSTTGTVVCKSDPSGARVALDGREVGTTPTMVEAVAPGEHLLRILLEDGRAYQETIDVGTGADIHRAWFWGTAGGALALGAVALGTGIYGRSLYDEFHDPATSRSRQEEIQPLEQDMMLTTDVLVSAAGALALAAAVLAFFTDFGGDGPADADVDFELPSARSAEPMTPDLADGGMADP